MHRRNFDKLDSYEIGTIDMHLVEETITTGKLKYSVILIDRGKRKKVVTEFYCKGYGQAKDVFDDILDMVDAGIEIEVTSFNESFIKLMHGR